jgi:hypothetical protein
MDLMLGEPKLLLPAVPNDDTAPYLVGLLLFFGVLFIPLREMEEDSKFLSI